ncbi:hypothetical protein U1Q18_013316 [Sarracenia purpurea var. burkii]
MRFKKIVWRKTTPRGLKLKKLIESPDGTLIHDDSYVGEDAWDDDPELPQDNVRGIIENDAELNAEEKKTLREDLGISACLLWFVARVCSLLSLVCAAWGAVWCLVCWEFCSWCPLYRFVLGVLPLVPFFVVMVYVACGAGCCLVCSEFYSFVQLLGYALISWFRLTVWRSCGRFSSNGFWFWFWVCKAWVCLCKICIFFLSQLFYCNQQS